MSSWQISLKESLSVFSGQRWKMNLFLVVLWSSYTLTYTFNFIFSRVPVIKEFKELLFPFIVIICLLLALEDFIKGKFINVLLFYFFSALFLGVYYINVPLVNERFLELYFPAFFITVLPYVFVGKAFSDERLFNVLYYVSIVSIFIFFLYNFIVHPFSEMFIGEEKQESQGLAYRLLPFLLIVEWKTLEKFNLFRFSVVIFAFFMLFLLGSRGAILSDLVFIVFYLIFLKRLYKKIYWFLSLLLFTTLGFFYYDEILQFLFNLASDLGYNPRIIEMIMDEEISSDNGRDYIISMIFRALNTAPFGLGLCGVQGLTNTFYAHNLFLELVATFGWLVGGSLSVLFVIFLVKGYMSCSNDNQLGFYLILICSSVVPLMVSGIFYDQPFLFMLIGYVFCLIDLRKQRKVSVGKLTKM